MKKSVINIILSLAVVAGLAVSVFAPWWVVWFICFPVMVAAAVLLLKLNTDYIEAAGAPLLTREEYDRLMWWDKEKLYTPRDRAAIQRARETYYGDIDEAWAETDAGRYALLDIKVKKYHDEEFAAGIN